jgi:hypothetical protein
MEHFTPIQCLTEDINKHGGLIVIFREFQWRGKVLLEDQVSNPYKKSVCKDEHAPATTAACQLLRGSVSIRIEAV